MKRFIEFIKQKWVITLIGVIALCILIWFVGPLIAIAEKKPLAGELTRLLIIMAILILWGLNNVRLSMKAKKENNEFIQGIQADAASQQFDMGNESEEELGILQERFAEALEVLKKTERGKGQGLYELPWYIIIGPPGCGKTTALVNSGLEFPLAERFGKEALKGIGGTRHCDWWFTDQAVLIDTAGRYTTQDSHASVDATAWLGFLDMLKKNRRRRPINGVVLAISLQDLAAQSEVETAAHVKAVKARLQELNKRLGMKIPVYLMFTKCDLIAGFNEFFEDLGREERAQVWGTTFPEKDEFNVLESFNQGFDQLIQRLDEQMLTKIHQERDVNRRGRILTFSQQIQQLKPVVSDFIEKVFSGSRFHDKPYIRGFYFTSGTQNVTMIDRVVDSYANQMGMAVQPNAAGTGRSYFITRLLSDLIFAEAGLVGLNRRYEAGRLWVQRASYGTVLGTAALGAFAWSTSFTQNELKLNDVENQLEDFGKGKKQLTRHYGEVDTIPVISPLQEAIEVFDTDNIAFTERLGLYQGNRVKPVTRQAYYNQLEEVYLPSVKRRLEEQMRSGFNEPEYLLLALKAYLMLGMPERRNEDFIKNWMALDWEATLPGQAKEQNTLKEYLDDLIAGGFEPIELDNDLVERARYELRKIPLPVQVYSQIKKDYIKPDRYRSFEDVLGKEINKVFKSTDYKIPNLYTYDGYYRTFKPESLKYLTELAKDNWVLGTSKTDYSPADIKQFHDQVQDLYFKDYNKHWDTGLNQLRLQPFANLTEAANQLSQITGSYSPFRQVLDDVKQNTQLSLFTSGNLDKLKQANEVKKAARIRTPKADRLARVAGKVAKTTDIKTDAVSGAIATPVEKHFRDVNQVSDTTGKRDSELDGIIDALAGLKGYVASIAQSSDPAEAAYNAAKSKIGGSDEHIRKIRTIAATTPEPIKHWLMDIADQSWRLMIGGANGYLNQIYANTVLPLYKKGLDGRYPLFGKSQREVTLRDFSEYYRPGGVEDSFFQQYIKPFVNTRGRNWSIKKVDGQSIRISGRALKQFETSDKIRRVFFPDGSKQPNVKFAMKPVYLDANIGKFQLNIDGQRLVYRHGPRVPIRLVWPVDNSLNESGIIFEDLNGLRVGYKEKGIWSFFRMMDHFRVSNTNIADRFRVSYQLDGRRADYEISANSVINPFNSRLLRSYRAVNRL
ncbi:type VI secretion system membrane subunit TssM [Spartinivicinus poritis]|uniref:Type VI secretion system membrane subunit TssM n=1 Tax=Spartinivicinus poritis TaxID=2994640 RepID=A0ABT5UGF6_9GAMM|nr:type VI secretion system membrane subunit TssM [Spartinivicinus sp. A2-2]MDE1465475.1 type VI secretion system membrane subunit TssM [Spartinivicinus sp. A2-2]